MISFKNVSFSFEDKRILSDVNFEIPDGKFIGILGPNGGGKTTLLKLSIGLLKPTEGEIKIHEKRISYISQTTSMNDSSFPATVEEVVGLGLVTPNPFNNFKKKKDKIYKVLKELNLFDIRKKLVSLVATCGLCSCFLPSTVPGSQKHDRIALP